MAEKTVRDVLIEALENLGERDFKKFRTKLCDRPGEPRVRLNMVENKDEMDIADVLVQTFTENDAIAIAAEIMKSINKNQAAEGLLKSPLHLSAQRTSAGGSRQGVSTPSLPMEGMHFVDFHKLKLIERVTNIHPILDELLDKNIIQDEVYGELMAQNTSESKMRMLFAGPLKACGSRGKDIFYEILKKREKYLIEDLNGQ